MTDKELIRRALLGDPEAQKCCTKKEIVLPCPKCFGDGVKIKGDGHDIYDPDTLGYIDSIPDSILYVTCDNCNLCSNCITIEDGEEREDAEKRLIAEWNTRPAPPVGRCGECKYYTTMSHCQIHSLGPINMNQMIFAAALNRGRDKSVDLDFCGNCRSVVCAYGFVSSWNQHFRNIFRDKRKKT